MATMSEGPLNLPIRHAGTIGTADMAEICTCEMQQSLISPAFINTTATEKLKVLYSIRLPPHSPRFLS